MTTVTTVTTTPSTWSCTTCGARIRLDDRWIIDGAELCGLCAYDADPEWLEEAEADEPAYHAPSEYVERCRIAREERRRRTWPPTPTLDALREAEAARRGEEQRARRRESATRDLARREARKRKGA